MPDNAAAEDTLTTGEETNGVGVRSRAGPGAGIDVRIGVRSGLRISKKLRTSSSVVQKRQFENDQSEIRRSRPTQCK